MEDKIKRMKELIDTLNHASKMYYQFSTPIMTDFEYDRLYDELVVLENETKTVFSNSPTINVETEISDALAHEEHKSPMLSLSKTKQIDDLVSFIKDKEGFKKATEDVRRICGDIVKILPVEDIIEKT